MNTTCRACLNYTENGVRLLTLYKHYHYLPIIILNCTGIKVSINLLPKCLGFRTHFFWLVGVFLNEYASHMNMNPFFFLCRGWRCWREWFFGFELVLFCGFGCLVWRFV